MNLYRGYVNFTNKLIDNLAEMRKAGENKAANPAYAEQVRRLGFEYDGMILHEYYFENMLNGAAKLPADSKLMDSIKKSYGSYEEWEQDFVSIAALRGIGWAIMYKDPVTGLVSNHWFVIVVAFFVVSSARLWFVFSFPIVVLFPLTQDRRPRERPPCRLQAPAGAGRLGARLHQGRSCVSLLFRLFTLTSRLLSSISLSKSFCIASPPLTDRVSFTKRNNTQSKSTGLRPG